MEERLSVGADVLRSGDDLKGVAGPVVPEKVVLGRFRVLELAHSGGQAQLYRALDLEAKTVVALKHVQVHGDNYRHRAFLEVEFVARIKSSRVAGFREYHDDRDGSVWLVGPWIEGRNLREEIVARYDACGSADDARFALERVRQLGEELLLGLQDAHARSVIHRDLKPENIMITRAGVVVVDFGIAKGVLSGDAVLTEYATPRTRPYAAPEADSSVLRPKFTFSSDVFSVGVVLLELLAAPEFPDMGTADRVDALRKHVEQGLPITQLRPDVPGSVAAVVIRALSKAPADRYRDASQMLMAWRAAWQNATVVETGDLLGTANVVPPAEFVGTSEAAPGEFPAAYRGEMTGETSPTGGSDVSFGPVPTVSSGGGRPLTVINEQRSTRPELADSLTTRERLRTPRSAWARRLVAVAILTLLGAVIRLVVIGPDGAWWRSAPRPDRWLGSVVAHLRSSSSGDTLSTHAPPGDALTDGALAEAPGLHPPVGVSPNAESTTKSREGPTSDQPATRPPTVMDTSAPAGAPAKPSLLTGPTTGSRPPSQPHRNGPVVSAPHSLADRGRSHAAPVPGPVGARRPADAAATPSRTTASRSASASARERRLSQRTQTWTPNYPTAADSSVSGAATRTAAGSVASPASAAGDNSGIRIPAEMAPGPCDEAGFVCLHERPDLDAVMARYPITRLTVVGPMADAGPGWLVADITINGHRRRGYVRLADVGLLVRVQRTP